jgi:hypothetical protein
MLEGNISFELLIQEDLACLGTRQHCVQETLVSRLAH